MDELIEALESKNEKEALRILSSDPNSHNWKDLFHKTPLHYAAELCENEKIIDFLLEKGAHLEAKSNWPKETPLHCASKNSAKIVRFFLKKGANIEAKDTYGETPLHDASSKGKEEIVKLLLEKGANIEAKDENELTPLHYASSKGKEEIVKLLLEKGANIEAKDKDGRTPLHRASSEGHDKVVKVLFKKGANIHVKDKSELTPLHCASRYGREENVKLLLEKGAKINAKDKDGLTPLHWAAKNGNCASSFGAMRDEENVKLLLEKGANIEAKDKDGSTPLHCAARFGKDKNVKLLIEKGANIKAKDKKLWTPLHCVCTNKQHGDKIAKLLLEKGLDAIVYNEDEVTPYFLALSHANKRAALVIVRYLPLCDQMTRSRRVFKKMIVDELKEELRKRSLLTTGRKAELLERLIQNEEQRINKAREEEKRKQKEEQTKKRKDTNSSSSSSPKRRKTSSQSPSTSTSVTSSSSSRSLSPSCLSAFSTSTSPSVALSPSSSSSSSSNSSASSPSLSSSSSLSSPSSSLVSCTPHSSVASSSSSVPSSSPFLSVSNVIAFESFNDPPPSRCFNHSPKLNFEDSVRALLLGFEGEKPQNVDDLSIASKDDVYCLISRCKRALRAKRSPEIQTLVEKMGENSALAIIAYTCESPYPLHKWLNAWLSQGGDDVVVQNNVGPFFRLFYQGLENLPRHTQGAIQQIQVASQLPFFQNLYDHPPEDGSELAFWGVPSFLEGTHLEAEGEGEEKKIIYRCAQLNCVSLEGLAIVKGKGKGKGEGGKVMPLAPAMFRVIGSEKVQSKLVIDLEHMTQEHYVDAYVQPSSHD